ncbi:coiled-coil-helix-coiled-coil-helix domain-containing protein 5 isoform 2-T2 [Erethizon dorsatum]
MQAALEITARYCGRELDQYGQCVAAKPESWQRDCHYLKMSIARCTSAQSARRVLSLLRPLRNVFGRMRQPLETVLNTCAVSCSVLSRCSRHIHPHLQRLSHFLPPEDSFDFRKTGHECLASQFPHALQSDHFSSPGGLHHGPGFPGLQDCH